MIKAKLAAALGISGAMVSKLSKRGMPTESVEVAQEWRRQHLHWTRTKGVRGDTAPRSRGHTREGGVGEAGAAEARADTVPDYQESRARREAAEADKAEMLVRQLRGELIERAPVIAAWSRQTAAARDAMLSLADRLAPIVAAESDARRIKNILDAEIRAAMNAFAEGAR